MKPEPQNASLVVLAAGLSTRMGIPKPLLFFDRRNTFIEKIVNTYRQFGVNKVVVVVNEHSETSIKRVLFPERSGVVIVRNDNPAAERFLSLKLGLAEVAGDACFLHNADNPFVAPETLEVLLKHAGNNTFAVPVYEGKSGHPVLIGKEIVNQIIHEKSIDFKINEYLKQFQTIGCNVSDAGVAVNVDTMQNYLFFFSRELWTQSVAYYKKIKP